MTGHSETDRHARMMQALHAFGKRQRKGDPATPPIVSSVKFNLPGDPEAPFVYGRYGTPTLEATEAALGALEGAPVIGFPSGMAAVTAALFSSVKSGDRLLLPSDGYFAVRALIAEFLEILGVKADYVPTPALSTHSLGGYSLVWVETPSNPGLDICDLQRLASRTKLAGIPLIADNTTATPFLQPVLDLGADISICSDTKAVSGHGDALFGHVASRNEGFMARVRAWRKMSGSTPGPWESFLVQRGLQTLDVRLQRMCTNAKAVAELASNHAKIRNVRYPGLETDPCNALAAQQMSDFGFLVGLTFSDAATAEQFIEHTASIYPSTSFGAVHTSGERRARWGDAVPEGYVRLSVGCEPTSHLLRSLKDSLDAL